VFGAGSHFTGLSGSLPLQQSTCATSWQEEEQRQEKQEEVRSKPKRINYLNKENALFGAFYCVVVTCLSH